jgi:3-oxoacyl-[acyl-carrier-protein] synthase-3
MKYTNVKIKGTGIYQPNNIIKNEYYIQAFKEIAADIESLLLKTGKNERGIINNENENSLTMAIKAAEKALENANISADKLDMIVFASDTPEYLSPSNALIISNQLKAKNANIVYDINANCLSMLVALDQISCIMKVKKDVKYTLVVSGIYSSSISREDCLVTYPMVGDAAAAIILEKKEEDIQRGFIEAKYLTLSQYYENAMSPACGMSKARKDEVNEYDRKMKWIPFPMDFCPEVWAKMIKEFANEYKFEISDIDNFFLSQLTINYLKKTAKLLDIENYEEKFPYIGDIYGYTGATSPIIALHYALQTKNIKKESKAIFASVGTGLILNSILYIF